jgi:hypothetical protein
VRGALTQAEGFSIIRTDFANRTCSFDYTKSEAELTAQLNELAKTCSHLQDWSRKR